MPANEKISKEQFACIMSVLCQRWHIAAYADYVSERYWPAFSRLEDEGQRAFWHVLGVQEVSDVFSKDQGGQDMPPRIAIFVQGGVVQEVTSDTADVLSSSWT
jgi:hypothetical protein